MEGYEGVAVLGGSAPQRRLYSRGAPLKPALVVLVGGVEGGGWWRCVLGVAVDFYYITFRCSSISRGCR